ncbi:MAG: cytochrome c oxidase subunit II [Actinobacteria bacterium]|nr:cytochrome c oxidase subunit II [Actinomycetota bacterium]
MSRRSQMRRFAPLVGVALLLAACGGNQKLPQNYLDPKGPAARTINNLFMPVLGVAGVVFVIVLGLCLFVPLKFRARKDADEDVAPRQIHGNFALEIGWTIVPALILIVIGVFTLKTVFTLSKEPPKTALSVEVIGQQWWWEYRYDLDRDGKFDEIVTANDLVIPAGEKVKLTITSRDVIHSFWVPKLNGKRDAVPGRKHPLWLQADKPGEYVGQCTEFCGLSHAEMRIKAVALSRSAFDDWTKRMQRTAPRYSADDTSLAAQGYQVFTQQLCASCHVINGVNDKQTKKFTADGGIKTPGLQVSGRAPNLTHLMARTTFAGGKFYLRKNTKECNALGLNWAQKPADLQRCIDRTALEAWLRNPPGQKAMAPEPVPGRTGRRGMPNLNLSEQQIDQLVAYLETLK